jgi:cytochrome b involved in lipid metabolism
MPLIVEINGHKYDASDFLPNHPGENPDGIPRRTISNYPDQDISKIFEMYHYHKPARKEKVLQILEECQRNGECKGLKFIS